MNNSKLKSINVAGLIGYIVTIILIVCAITAMVFTTIALIGSIVISKEEITITVSTDIDVTSSGDIINKLNKFMSVGETHDLNDFVTDEGERVKINDRDLSEFGIAKKDGGIIINAKTNDIVFSIGRVILALSATLLLLAAATVMLFMLKNLMKALKNCETPFAENVISSMTKFAYSLIPTVVIGTICNGVWEMLRKGSRFSFSVNLGTILLVAVVFILVVIFKYGAQLQQESDETL